MTDLDAIPPPDDDFIDRIVDGTLTPAELRAAIDRLDREPDGWKRCAAGVSRSPVLARVVPCDGRAGRTAGRMRSRSGPTFRC